MKKLLVVGMLIASVAAYTSYGHMYEGREGRVASYQELTPEQEENLSVLEQKVYRSRRQYMTEMQSKRLEVERLMLEDGVEWKKVEKLNEDIARLQGKMKTESMKYYKDISDITGYKYMSGMDGYHMDGSDYHMHGDEHHMYSGGHHMNEGRHHMSSGRW